MLWWIWWVRCDGIQHKLLQFDKLDLSFNSIGDEGARALASSPSLSSLTLLKLHSNDVSEEGTSALRKSPYLSNTEIHMS